MKLNIILLAAFLLVARVNALSLLPNNGNTKAPAAAASAVNRRVAFTGVTAAAVAAISGGSILFPTAANAAGTKGAKAFVGTFTDPINHPGGIRTITLLEGKTVGDYQLAEVRGGGGQYEPESFVLPAAVIGDRNIVIDFSPKGGPRDFCGILDRATGDILFKKDGNRWPRQKNR